MIKDTAGNIIKEIMPNCDCGLTSGCQKCNPSIKSGFIGMLEPGEADRMRGEWELYKKQLNDSFARKNEILFPDEINKNI